MDEQQLFQFELTALSSKRSWVVDLSFDRLSQNCLQLSRSPGMFKLFMIVDDSLFSCFAPLRYWMTVYYSKETELA